MPTWLLALFACLVLVQITLEIWALLDLIRRPADQVVFHNKWVWAAIILLVNLIGAIVYFAVGRVPQTAETPAAEAPASDRAHAAADVLYGKGVENDR